jgi:hypothetical protein
MAFVIYLMIANMAAAAGAAAQSPLFTAIPWIVVALMVGSVAVAIYLRSARPDVYARIGRSVFDEVPAEQVGADADEDADATQDLVRD